MDITAISQYQNCLKHQQNNISFLKVNEISNQENSKIFYCIDCINEDLDFKGINHILIPQIIQQSQTNIIQKWPPINDYSILDKLNKQIQNQDSSQSIIEQINTFFNQLKDEIFKKIDFCQKKMINQALDLPFEKDQILKKYQEISQIEKLKQLLQSYQKDQSERQEIECRSFIQQILTQKQLNTELLQNLLQQSIEIQQLISFDKSNQIKQCIYSLIDDINFFPNCSLNNDQGNRDNVSIQRLSNSEKVMQLVSNKSNFCTQEFLDSLSKSLEIINSQLGTVDFNMMHQENKQPIRFDQINNSKLEEIDEYIKHIVQLQNNSEYNSNITQSERVKKLFQIFESKSNFINESMKTYIKNILTEFYPLIQKLDTLSVFTLQENFDLLKDQSDEVLQDLIQVLRKKQELIHNNSILSVSDQIKKLPLVKFQFNQTELDKVLSNLPVFDILTRTKATNILKDFDMQKAKYKDGNLRIQIIKNIDFSQEIFINEQQYNGQYKQSAANCISSKVLEREKKYIFRLQLQANCNSKRAFSIGLMQESKKDLEAGHIQKLSCDFRYDNLQIEHRIGDGIDKYINGNQLNQQQSNFMLEIRIHLIEKILQVLDYPNYQYKIELEDQYKDKLIQFDDLCLYFHLEDDTIKYILKEAFLTDDFVD